MTFLAVREPKLEDPLHPWLMVLDRRAGRIQVSGGVDRGQAHHLDHAVSALAHITRQARTPDLTGVSCGDVKGLRSLVRSRVETGRHVTPMPMSAAPFLTRRPRARNGAARLCPDRSGA